MPENTLLHDLAVILLIAGLVTVIFNRFKQPVVLGYLVAGVIIGPYTPPFELVRDHAAVLLAAQLGMILLMFSLGLHFSLRQLAKVGGTAFVAASLEILLMLLIGYAVGRAFGWSDMDSLFLGGILSISSTTIIIKVLQDLGLMRQHSAELIFGILVVEDILGIALIALLSTVAIAHTPAIATMPAHASTTEPSPPIMVLDTIGRLSVFLTVLLVFGLLIVPWLLRYVAKFNRNEMLLVMVLGLCFGSSLLASVLGYSVALGAFVMGAMIAETAEHGRIARLIEPVRDMFSAIFFVAIGMEIDPKLIIEYAVPIMVITLAVIVGKICSCTFGAFVAGNDSRTSLRVGMSLAQIGEFSFIIAALGSQYHVTQDFLYPVAVTVTGTTTFFTPYLIRSSDPLVSLFDRTAPKWLTSYLDLYTRWTARLRQTHRGGSELSRILRRWIIQMVVNMLLITGVMLTADRIGELPMMQQWRLSHQWTQHIGIAWLIGTAVCLPILVAVLRKLRAISMFVAELSVTAEAGGEYTAALRAMVANTILIIGAVCILLWMLLLSWTILPPWPVLAALFAVLGVVVLVMWQRLIRVYARAQVQLRETLAAKPEPMPLAEFPAALYGAKIDEILLPEKSTAAGKSIHEVEIRKLTGAGIVGIERGGHSIVNPGPEEKLLPGDRIYLFGSPAQVDAAREFLLA
ncbi:MAG TPA: cation:proton antiporter [Phycisphaerae bacterium]|nr:cation:proton antiporter [Phycisphaerae bacterium]